MELNDGIVEPNVVGQGIEVLSLSLFVTLRTTATVVMPLFLTCCRIITSWKWRMVFVSEFFFRNSIRKAACQPTAETALHIKLRLQYWGMFVVAPDPNPVHAFRNL